MSQELEIEFKNAVTKEEFSHLCRAFSLDHSHFKMQSNLYFDTSAFHLKSHNAALRIRKKEDTYVLTLKQAHPRGMLETHQPITKEKMEEMVQLPSPFPDGPVKEELKKLEIPLEDLSFLGELKTNRAEIDYNNGVLVFDISYYLNQVDYEIEYEVKDEEEGKINFYQLLTEHSISIQQSENKIKRFFDALTRNKN